jgi:hypothetical protein
MKPKGRRPCRPSRAYPEKPIVASFSCWKKPFFGYPARRLRSAGAEMSSAIAQSME